MGCSLSAIHFTNELVAFGLRHRDKDREFSADSKCYVHLTKTMLYPHYLQCMMRDQVVLHKKYVQ